MHSELYSGLASLGSPYEIVKPGVVGAGLNICSAAKVLDGRIALKPFEHNAALLFSSEPVVGNAFNIPDVVKSLGIGHPQLILKQVHL